MTVPSTEHEGECAVVTGCASGIGRCVAARLQQSGIKVFGLDINECDLPIRSYVCDTSDEKQAAKICDAIGQETSSINYLVNCAGMLTIGRPLCINEMPMSQWDAIIKINLRSTVVMTRAMHPFLTKAGNAAIINVSSEQAFSPQRGFCPYIVSKAAINAFTQSCALEFLSDNIRVNAVALGTVKTAILESYCGKQTSDTLFKQKDSTVPFGIMSVDDAADLILFMMSSKNKYMTGEVVRADGGGRFVPSLS